MRCVAPFVAVRKPGGVRLLGNARSGFFKSGEFPLACGTCVACLKNRARNWAVRATHEFSFHTRSCFLTLTYDEEHLPYAGSLVPEHFQKFVRAVRAEFGKGIKFLGCGEYGERWGRPHYHAIFFGVDFFQDRYVAGKRQASEVFRSPSLESLWPMGRSEIGSATVASAGYVAGYVAKKCSRERLEGREPEFLRMSLRPALGMRWIAEHWRSVYARDSVVMDGFELPVPRAYDKWLAREHPLVWEEVQFKREEGRSSPSSDSELQESRLVACEEYLTAKVNLFAREVEV